MMIADDLDLLEKYARESSEEAFAELVSRHLDLVYSAALRQVRSRQLAEEVAQSVFTDLSHGAHKLKPGTILTAWLYQVTRRTAIDVVRRESRRQFREQIAVTMADMHSTPTDWTQVESLLDEAMETLDAPDRTAILLRYFDSKSLREIGQTLGTSEDAAQKRVSRAVEQLRGFLSKRGTVVGSASFVMLLSTHAVQSAPIGLGGTISATVVSGAAIHQATTIGITKAILMTTIQKTLIAATLAVAVGTGIYESSRASSLQGQMQRVQERQQPLAAEILQLHQERDEAIARLEAAKQESEQLRRQTSEVPRLRGEVARLRSLDSARLTTTASDTGNDAALDAAFKTWAVRATQLKQRLEQMPDKKIPELQFLTEKDWFDAVKNTSQLETDEDFRNALGQLRGNAKSDFVRLAQQALRGFTQANDGLLPTDLSQLKPYFQTPVDDSVLNRYALLQTGKVGDVPGGQYLVAETAPPVDDEYDTVHRFGLNDVTSSTVNRTEDAIKQAGIQFAEANNGLLPTDASQLEPYLKQPVDSAKVQKLLNQIPPGVTTLKQLKASQGQRGN
jgi:RNA polymerase sigma factor (sigma-70 family)